MLSRPHFYAASPVVGIMHAAPWKIFNLTLYQFDYKKSRNFDAHNRYVLCCSLAPSTCYRASHANKCDKACTAVHAPAIRMQSSQQALRARPQKVRNARDLLESISMLSSDSNANLMPPHVMTDQLVIAAVSQRTTCKAHPKS